jgi:hypothetical protein
MKSSASAPLAGARIQEGSYYQRMGRWIEEPNPASQAPRRKLEWASANQPNQSVTHEADPEIGRQSPIGLVDMVLRAQWQVSLNAEVNGIPGHHSKQGLPEPPFH